MDEGLAFLLSLILSSMLQNFDDMITETRELLTLSVIDDSLWDNISNVARSVFVPFGTTIIVICLMIEIAQTASRVDLLKWEHAIKIGVKMVLTKVAVDNVSLFLEACYKQSIRFINSVPNDLNVGGNYTIYNRTFKWMVGAIWCYGIHVYFMDSYTIVWCGYYGTSLW